LRLGLISRILNHSFVKSSLTQNPHQDKRSRLSGLS